MKPDQIQGIGASPGLAVGTAFFVDRRRLQIPKYHIALEQIEEEILRLKQAILLADNQFEQLKTKFDPKGSNLTHIGILEAYRLILHDEHVLLPTYERIQKELLNAEWALQKTMEDLKRRFDAIGIEHLRERRSDIGFVGEQVLHNLLGKEPDKPVQPPPQSIVVAYELSPSDLVSLHQQQVLAVITATGGRTSHMVILARAFQIPVVVGIGETIDQLGTGDLLIVDGSTGKILCAPSPELVQMYQTQIDNQHAQFEMLKKNKDKQAETLDHHRLQLVANIEFHEEVSLALQFGAQGIGLYRTEFLFLDRTTDPTEEEHFLYTKEVLLQLGNRPATFRTFDLGTDKLPPFLTGRLGMIPFSSELNPALGLRSLRLCLREKTLFKTQLRGLLRASVYGDMRLMLPMVSGLNDVREAKAMLEECKEELEKQGIPYRKNLSLGIMIEMPSAVIVADHLAKEVDFFSIGTNDLVQYTLALDRANEHVEALYDPLHPAIIRMIRMTVEQGHKYKRKVSLCGEMAGNPMFVPLLLGLGLDELSMNPASIPQAKHIINQVTFKEATALAEQALQLDDGKEIELLLKEAMSRISS